jgi:ribosomal-protein-alanine N-acetyltransferase
MNAVVKPRRLVLRPMLVADLDAVLAIEQAAYTHPWTRGNFIDSLHAGYLAQTLHDDAGMLLGYYLAMPGVDEMHLLNITVAPARQGLGHARYMLDALCLACLERALHKLWLEVRVSNERALQLYERYGFVRMGLRRDYYPFSNTQREDAVLMGLDIIEAGAP